jgi:hypothetical protein
LVEHGVSNPIGYGHGYLVSRRIIVPNYSAVCAHGGEGQLGL